MKFTICVTHRCNLDCSYCYIGKKPEDMSLPLAEKVVDFIFSHAIPEEKTQIGFFGGEPLLEFDRVRDILNLIQAHPRFRKDNVEIHLVSNGTVLSDEILDFIAANNLTFCISCDGPPDVHNAMRKFRNGRGSAAVVEKNLRTAMRTLPLVLVNAVYHPQTFRKLPETVEYFSSLGLRTITMNPDYSAPWTQQDIDEILPVYRRIGDLYTEYFQKGDPHYISLIDSKILMILQGGYKPEDRCRMGSHEFAFGPSGNIYPCERLVGCDDGTHAIGSLLSGSDVVSCARCGEYNSNRNEECRSCGIREYCMNSCGCSNFFSTGSYDHAGPFLCAAERAAVSVSFNVFDTLNEQMGSSLLSKLGQFRKP